MARTFVQMMQDVRDGITGKKKRDLGPLGEAVTILNAAIKLALEKNLYETSPIFRSSRVVLDNLAQTRIALEAAVRVVNALEDPKFDTKNIGLLVGQFKSAAVKARLHQYVPVDKLPKIEQKLAPTILRPS